MEFFCCTRAEFSCKDLEARQRDFATTVIPRIWRIVGYFFVPEEKTLSDLLWQCLESQGTKDTINVSVIRSTRHSIGQLLK